MATLTGYGNGEARATDGGRDTGCRNGAYAGAGGVGGGDRRSRPRPEPAAHPAGLTVNGCRVDGDVAPGRTRHHGEWRLARGAEVEHGRVPRGAAGTATVRRAGVRGEVVRGHVRRASRRPPAGQVRALRSGTGRVAACSVRTAPKPLRVVVVAAVVTAATVVLLALLGAFGAAAVPDRTALVQVRPGQTLSEIAATAAPSSDRTAVLDRIHTLNGLNSSTVQAGRTLVVPVSD